MKNGERMDQVAEWMSMHGGSIADRSVEAAWEHVRRGLGAQAT